MDLIYYISWGYRMIQERLQSDHSVLAIALDDFYLIFSIANSIQVKGRVAQSVQRLTTVWTVPVGRDFPPVQTGPGAHPASCTMGTGSFPGVKYGRGVLLTTHPLPVPWSWKSRAMPLPTLWATTGSVTGTLYLSLIAYGAVLESIGVLLML